MICHVWTIRRNCLTGSVHLLYNELIPIHPGILFVGWWLYDVREIYIIFFDGLLLYYIHPQCNLRDELIWLSRQWKSALGPSVYTGRDTIRRMSSPATVQQQHHQQDQHQDKYNNNYNGGRESEIRDRNDSKIPDHDLGGFHSEPEWELHLFCINQTW